MPVMVEGKVALEPILWACSGSTIGEISEYITEMSNQSKMPFEYGLKLGLIAEQINGNIRYKLVFPEIDGLTKLDQQTIESVSSQRETLLAKLLSQGTPSVSSQESSPEYQPPQDAPQEAFKDLV